MANNKGRKKSKREQKKIQRLLRFIGVDLCACGGGHQLKCQGKCRNNHIDPKTSHVKCGELYQILLSDLKKGGTKRPKRTWNYGRQREANKYDEKQKRREKMARHKRNDD